MELEKFMKDDFKTELDIPDKHEILGIVLNCQRLKTLF